MPDEIKFDVRLDSDALKEYIKLDNSVLRIAQMKYWEFFVSFIFSQFRRYIMEYGKVTYKKEDVYYRVRIGIGNKKAYECICYHEIDAQGDAKFLKDGLKDGYKVEELIKALKKAGCDYYLVETKK